MAILSRFRSKERDIQTDVGRVLPILDAVEAALREAEVEHRGLKVRLDEASSRAAFLFGNGLESDVDNDPAGTAKLKDAEDILVRGQMRDRYLERQTEGLRQVKAILDSIVKPETGETERR